MFEVLPGYLTHKVRPPLLAILPDKRILSRLQSGQFLLLEVLLLSHLLHIHCLSVKFYDSDESQKPHKTDDSGHAPRPARLYQICCSVDAICMLGGVIFGEILHEKLHEEG